MAAVPVILCMNNLIVPCHIKYFEKHNDVYEPVLHGILPYFDKVMDRREAFPLKARLNFANTS